MLGRFHDPSAQEVAERVAKACLIIPPVESDLQAAVGRAKAILDAQSPNFTGGELGENWHDRFYSQALLREATNLIEGGKTTRD